MYCYIEKSDDIKAGFNLDDKDTWKFTPGIYRLTFTINPCQIEGKDYKPTSFTTFLGKYLLDNFSGKYFRGNLSLNLISDQIIEKLTDFNNRDQLGQLNDKEKTQLSAYIALVGDFEIIDSLDKMKDFNVTDDKSKANNNQKTYATPSQKLDLLYEAMNTTKFMELVTYVDGLSSEFDKELIIELIKKL
jgi:hypothetical protein